MRKSPHSKFQQYFTAATILKIPIRFIILVGLLSAPMVTLGQKLENLKFNVSKIPFSRYGSYMALSTINKNDSNVKDLHLDELTGGNIWTANSVLNIQPVEGKELLTVEYEATPLSLKGKTRLGTFTAYFESAEIVHIVGDGPGLLMSGKLDENNALRIPGYPNSWKLRNSNFVVTVKSGVVKFEGAHEKGSFLITPRGNQFDVIIEQYRSDWLPKNYTIPHQVSTDSLRKELRAWEHIMPTVPDLYSDAKDLAAYINWSCMIKPSGNVNRYGMVMSKNWMYNIWSWDNCFNAISLGYHESKLSWDEFMVLFDQQDKTGAMPDYINAHHMVWQFRKPPVHGWALSKLMTQYQLSNKQLTEIYPKLSAWTNYWFNYRDGNHNGLPEYYHGNDSGWDNSSSFDMGFPAEGPDLAAFLVKQMDVLSELAGKMGKVRESAMWKQKADETFKKMIAYFWNGEKFISKNAVNGKINEQSQSLMAYLPIILGDRLPLKIRNKMIADLKKPDYLVTRFGIASESPQSKLYSADGYWRGPIWAPTTLLIIDGLKSLKENDFAAELATKFCDTCNNSGFAENFDALTGEPLRDPAYTWTSSVFMILAHDYLTKSGQ
jgi:glycogen debranching enzyme